MNLFFRVCNEISKRNNCIRAKAFKQFSNRGYCVQAKEVIVKNIQDKVNINVAAHESVFLKDIQDKALKSLVPEKSAPSVIDKKKLPNRTKIDASTIALLERLSLVDCANRQGIETLEEAIAFADQILQVDTKGVEPLITVLEDKPLVVREDKVTEGNCREDILSNASVTEDEYFIAPPGNIPLEPRENLLHEETKQ